MGTKSYTRAVYSTKNYKIKETHMYINKRAVLRYTNKGQQYTEGRQEYHKSNNNFREFWTY